MNDTEKIDAILARLKVWSNGVSRSTVTELAWSYAYLVDDITKIIVGEGQ